MLKNKDRKISTNKPIYELQSFGQTLNMSNFFQEIKTTFNLCTGHWRSYSVWKIENGFKYPIPINALKG